MARPLAWLTALSMLGASCAPSLSGLSGGREDAGDDAGERDGGMHDATMHEPESGVHRDATTVDDRSTTPDAHVEAAVDAGLHWCATQPAHTFCADFDEPSSITAWNTTVVSDGGALVLDDTESLSPPFSLRADLTRPDASTYATAQLEKTFTTTPASVEVAFEVHVDSGCNTGIDVLAVYFDSNEAFVVYVQNSPVGVSLEEAAPVGDGGEFYGHVFPSVALPPDTWAHVSASVTFGNNGAGTATLSLDDAGPAVTGFPSPLTPKGGTVTLKAGAANYSNHPYGACLVHIDNVTLDLE